jgi:large subunit ribosomal protein L20
MTRVKRGVIKMKRRRNVLSQTKGYRFGRSTKEAAAKEAIVHAGKYAFAHRKDKKADKRKLWQVKIGAVVREQGMSYSKFIGVLTKKNIKVDRKIMADLAQNNPETFSRLLKSIA